tara:strand:- start:33 stop:3365 length:3333 start_codon:yes stop_codon:yes gene_type:complete
MPSDRTLFELDNIEDDMVSDNNSNKGILILRDSCFNYIKKKCNCLKEILIKLKKDFQKVLTLTDIGTDVRTCYIMYSVNPYWYTVMLSAIVTPFIVFWASSYNFKFVIKLSSKADSDNSLKNKALSAWITALSLPIIGVILTIFTIIGIYILDILKPVIIALKLYKLEIFDFWLECLYEFKNSDSMEFFTLSELFFESIPQVVLQLWIYILYSDSFTDSSGNPILNTFDISLSLGSAFLNIVMNGYHIKNRASAWGLSVSSYIPYFMGSQLEIVKDSCIPVKNWLNNERYCCDLTKIETFFVSNMMQMSTKEIEESVNRHEVRSKIYDNNFSDSKNLKLRMSRFSTFYKSKILDKNQKKIVIPLKMNKLFNYNDFYEVNIKRTSIIFLGRILRKAHDMQLIGLDIDPVVNKPQSGNKTSNINFHIKNIVIENNRDCSFMNDWKKYDLNRIFGIFDNIPVLNCIFRNNIVKKLLKCGCKTRFMVPIIEQKIYEEGPRLLYNNRIRVVESAKKYIERIKCNPSNVSEKDIFKQLSESRIRIIENFKCEHNGAKLLSKSKRVNVKDECRLYYNKSVNGEQLYNSVQYIDLITTMLFDVSNFYLYQSKTIEFYMILSTYGNTGVIMDIYLIINFLVSNEIGDYSYLFNDDGDRDKWEKVKYMNNELINKVTQYLSIMVFREAVSKDDLIIDIKDNERTKYLAKIIVYSLIDTLFIYSDNQYKLREYKKEPLSTSFDVNGINFRDQFTLVEIHPFMCWRVVIQTEFDVEHRYYYIKNIHTVNYESLDYKDKDPTDSINCENKTKNYLTQEIGIDNLKLDFKSQKTTAIKFIFVKKLIDDDYNKKDLEQRDKSRLEEIEKKMEHYFDPSNLDDTTDCNDYPNIYCKLGKEATDSEILDNKYYILTQCRRYFLQFKVIAGPEKLTDYHLADSDLKERNITDNNKNELKIVPYLIPRKNLIGFSPKKAEIAIIRGDFKPNIINSKDNDNDETLKEILKSIEKEPERNECKKTKTVKKGFLLGRNKARSKSINKETKVNDDETKDTEEEKFSKITPLKKKLQERRRNKLKSNNMKMNKDETENNKIEIKVNADVTKVNAGETKVNDEDTEDNVKINIEY